MEHHFKLKNPFHKKCVFNMFLLQLSDDGLYIQYIKKIKPKLAILNISLFYYFLIKNK